jgi:hypothetical protein
MGRMEQNREKGPMREDDGSRVARLLWLTRLPPFAALAALFFFSSSVVNNNHLSFSYHLFIFVPTSYRTHRQHSICHPHPAHAHAAHTASLHGRARARDGFASDGAPSWPCRLQARRPGHCFSRDSSRPPVSKSTSRPTLEAPMLTCTDYVAERGWHRTTLAIV